MKETNTTKLSSLVLWQPLRFATITFLALSITGLLYSLIAGKIYAPAPVPPQPLLWLCLFAFMCCTSLFFYKAPRFIPDRTSFIATHNAQILLISVAFILMSYYLSQHAQEILFKLMLAETISAPTFIITITAFCLVFLYLVGVLLSNIFLKFRRIQNFNIPTWKIFCSIPFGFSALWTPGYILPDEHASTNNITIKSNWYKKITNTITSHKTTTISVFTLITMLSGFIYGINTILLTFILALIFGIWSLTTGTKKFIKSMPNKYSTFSVIMNIAIIIILTLGTRIYTNLNKTTINITETTETINL